MQESKGWLRITGMLHPEEIPNLPLGTMGCWAAKGEGSYKWINKISYMEKKNPTVCSYVCKSFNKYKNLSLPYVTDAAE